MMPADEYWSCVMTYPAREIEAIVNLRRQGFQTFFPFFFTKGRSTPIFPGYAFVKIEGDGWSPIWNTRGVLRILTGASGEDGRKPARLPGPFVASMQRYLKPHSSVVGEMFPSGTYVKIKRGPLLDRVALVLMSAEERVRVLVSLMGRELEAEFLVGDLENAEAL